MSDLSTEIEQVSGIPEIHLMDTPTQAKAVASKVNDIVSVIPQEQRMSFIGHFMVQLMGFFNHKKSN